MQAYEIFNTVTREWDVLTRIAPTPEQADRFPNRVTHHVYVDGEGRERTHSVIDVFPAAPEAIRGTNEADLLRNMARQQAYAWYVQQHKNPRTTDHKEAEGIRTAINEIMRMTYGSRPHTVTPHTQWDYFISVARFVRDAKQAMYPHGPR